MFKSTIRTIAQKDIKLSIRDQFILLATGFLTLAALISLVTGAIALATDVATYEHAKVTLLALGKSVDQLAAPEFYPLKLMRGAVEQIEIMGAIIGILIGYRAAIGERGRLTLALILTRPVTRMQFLGGKFLSAFVLIFGGLALVFFVSSLMLYFISGVGLNAVDYVRIAITWFCASIYIMVFFTLAFGLSLHLKTPSHALLYSFIIWLMVVLIAPQIGDTLDPDNQVAGGVFKQLHVPKAEEDRIKAGYAGFESIRGGIEAASITKHFERFGFAVLGIKDTYTGVPLADILKEKSSDFWWIVLTELGLAVLVFALPISSNRLTKE